MSKKTRKINTIFFSLDIAKKYGIKNLPQLVFFRNRDPLLYKGDLKDEDEVLAWLTDAETLEIPGKIEEVNIKMLDKILSENDHVVVFFCEYDCFYSKLIRFTFKNGTAVKYQCFNTILMDPTPLGSA